MNLLYFILFSILIFLCTLIGYKKYHNTALYALAIGGVVNANFFTAGTYPIDIFGLSFGIDSIIYTLFIFCVILMYIKEGRSQAYLLAISSIVAIMFSAIMQLVSDLLSNGSSFAVWNSFINFFISSIASIIAIVTMIELCNYLSKYKLFKNPYIITIFGILICTFINSGIYYTSVILISGVRGNYIWELLFTSFIGKTFALACSILALALYLQIVKIYNKKHSEIK